MEAFDGNISSILPHKLDPPRMEHCAVAVRWVSSTSRHGTISDWEKDKIEHNSIMLKIQLSTSHEQINAVCN